MSWYTAKKIIISKKIEVSTDAIYTPKPSACWWNEIHSRITRKDKHQDTCSRQSTRDLSFQFYFNPGIWIITRKLHGKWKWRLLVAVHHVLERQLIPEATFLPQSQSITAGNKKGKMSSYSDVHFHWVLHEESVIFLPKPSFDLVSGVYSLPSLCEFISCIWSLS